MIDIIRLSVPLFFVSMFVELGYLAHAKKLHYYRVNDAINSIGLGLISQIVDIFLKVVLYTWAYGLVVEHLSLQALFSLPLIEKTWYAWIAAFVLLDFLYYWFHRMSHQTALLWAGHVVHHQSEEYNLSTALRQGSFQALFSWAFYVVLGILGFPLEMFMTCLGLNLLYQFFVHTRAIDKLGPLEWVMNTPSHHRVHHGKDPVYCDRNHAGVFIVWDRIFGTFQAEGKSPTYGITIPLNSWNPIWANVGSFYSLGKEVAKVRGLDRLKILFMPPGWRPSYVGPSIVPVEVDPVTYRKFDPPVSRTIMIYSLIQFAVLLVIATRILDFAKDEGLSSSLRQVQTVGLSVWVIASVTALCGLLEGKPWAKLLEAVRLILLVFIGVLVGFS